MKKLVGLTAIVLLFTITINAQGNKDRQRKGNDFTPEQTATLQTKKMALNLDLNENQQKQVYDLMKEKAIERETVRTERQEQKEVGTPLTSEQKFDIQNQRLEKQIAQKAAMKNILSKEQYEKWSEMMDQRMKQGKKKMAQKGNRKGMKSNSPRNGK